MTLNYYYYYYYYYYYRQHNIHNDITYTWPETTAPPAGSLI